MAKRNRLMTLPRNADLEFTLVVVTPDMALEWLTNQCDNRNLRQMDIKVMADDMKNGRWKDNGETIKFLAGGKLADGQHRLHAVLEAEVNVPLRIVSNLDESALSTIDTGRARQVHDLMKILGDKLHSPVASSCASMMIRSTTQQNIMRLASKAKVVEFMQQHRDAIEFTVDAFSRRIKNITSQPILGAYARSYYTYTSPAERERLKAFAAVLLSGFPERGDEAAIVLRNYLTIGVEREIAGVVYLKAERAIASFMASELMERLYPARRELFPLPEEREQ